MDKKIEDITPANSQSTQTVKPIDDVPMPNVERSPNFFKKHKKIILGVLGVKAVLLILFLVLIVLPVLKTYNDAKVAYSLALSIQDSVKTQDFKKISASVIATKKQVGVVRSDLNGLAWTQAVPFLGGYTSDAIHAAAAGQYGLEAAEIAVKAVEPYGDLLGFKSTGVPAATTTEGRIQQIVLTLDKVTPQIDKVGEKMALVQKEMDQIDANRYPEEFGGKKIRSNIVEGKELINLSTEFLTEAKPLTKQLPALLGMNGESKYLVLFQNDKELRPTGGFITAYAVFRIDKGKLSLEQSDDIYKLDDTVTKHVAPPDPISRYLNVYGWRLRDANFSPDYASSTKTFLDIYANSTQKKPVLGVISVDTTMLVKLMEVLGPVGIYGTNFTTQKIPQCDCPMVVYELLKQAGQPRNYWADNRKDMIGQLLQSIMKKAMDAPSELNPLLFRTGLQMAQEKHVLFYLINPEAQKGVEALGFAGRIKTSPGDYLHISDANLGGAKSNLYVQSSVAMDTSITNSGSDTTLTISYRYPHAADNCSLERKEGLCLAGIYRDYLRVYLPKGAKISEARGFENKSQTYEDLGHTTIAGFFTVVPQGLAKVIIKYSVPQNYKAQGSYNLLIQKQPGTDAIPYKLTVNGQLQEFNLLQDKEVSIKL